MNRIATVVSLKSDGTAVVEIERASACGHSCGECRLCDGGTLKAEVENSARAKEGDIVTVETGTGMLLTGAGILYILPIALFIAFYGIAEWVLSLGNKLSVTAAITGFAAGIGIAVLISKRYKKSFRARIIEIIDIPESLRR